MTYLDNNATTRPADEVLAAMDEANRTLWANPSSVHRFGQLVRQRLELARASVASLIGAKPRELVLTSGGTEANNLAIWGTLGMPAGPGRDSAKLGPAALVTTAVEHAAVREPAEALERGGGRVFRLPLADGGVVDIDGLDAALDTAVAAVVTADRDAAGSPVGTVLVSVQWANNETGAVQPVGAIASAVVAARRRAGRSARVVLHLDATQAVGKLPVDVNNLEPGKTPPGELPVGADLLTLAAHKFHGPKGVGALFVKTGARLRPVLIGGPQEREKRGGTENVAGVIGMGVAAELAEAFVDDAAAVASLRGLRDRLEQRVRERVPSVVVNSGGVERLWNTSNLAFPGLEAEAVLLGLSERGVCGSAGAACSSGSLEPSPVLRAMGVPEAVAHGSVRLSLSRFTTEAEVDVAVEALTAVVDRLARVMPMGKG